MAGAYVTYDLEEESVKKTLNESVHYKVKEEMKKNGYHDRWIAKDETGKEQTYYLPNTSLWKPDISAKQGKDDLLSIAKSCGAKVERLIVVRAVDWAGIPGKEYKSKD